LELKLHHTDRAASWKEKKDLGHLANGTTRSRRKFYKRLSVIQDQKGEGGRKSHQGRTRNEEFTSRGKKDRRNAWGSGGAKMIANWNWGSSLTMEYFSEEFGNEGWKYTRNGGGGGWGGGGGGGGGGCAIDSYVHSGLGGSQLKWCSGGKTNPGLYGGHSWGKATIGDVCLNRERMGSPSLGKGSRSGGEERKRGKTILGAEGGILLSSS